MYVTHDQTEALTMGDRVAVLKDGILQQVDTPRNMYDRPVNAFVASFIGSPQMNMFSARITGDTAQIAGQSIAIERTKITTATAGGAQEIQIGARPEDLRLSSDPGAGIESEVVVVEELGADAYVYARVGGVDAGAFDIVVRVDGRSPPQKGDRAYTVIDPAHTHLFSSITGERL